jgi:hypothetical protein
MIKKRNLDASLVNYIDNLGMGIEDRGAVGGTVYYVENNSGNDKWDGLSIDTAFKTLAKAIAVSNVDIARRARWSRRNTIYYFADETADLVAFPNKCDVVGCGTTDGNSKAQIIGNHVPVNAGNYATRFFNVWFKAPADATPIITLASSTSGCQFIGCTFNATATTTIGIQATASPFLKVVGCRFEGAFATSYITFGTGEAGGTEIIKNTMVDSAASGIVVGSGATASWAPVIKENFIFATGIAINDAVPAGIFYIVRNDLVSKVSPTGSPSWTEAVVGDLNKMVGNNLTTATVMGPYPIIDTTT